MQRSPIRIATFIILFSILTVLVQFGVYYFLGSAILIYSLAAFVCLLFSYIFLEQTLSYESCFSYSLLNIFICAVIILLSYFSSKDSLLPYRPDLILFIILNWFIPLLYCIVRNLTDRSFKYAGFHAFYRNTNIVFILFYMGLLVVLLFLKNRSRTDAVNLIPINTIATLIDDYLNGYVTIGEVIKYFLPGIALFLPYGFYTILLLRYRGRLIRFLALLILPVAVEILQQVFLFGKADVDDVLLGLLGGFIGGLLYHLLNRIYRLVTDEDFLCDRPHYSYLGNSLHF